ncbi:hypothetical protein Syun_004458 [Stephania yunnanensis]|uniref:Epidermal patterning factor-like protein n=1 Tax=Stephania yunnanensis TaxID=152371 RepID=A0AAP0Q4Z1_9MAGN
MGSTRSNCLCFHPHFHLTLSLIFLVVSSSSILSEGRAVFGLTKSSQMGREEKVFLRAQIGSRPPTCVRRCSSCGHCEAVQVPVIPQEKGKRRQFNTASFRGEDGSNYKPMSWKCKCGDMIFNP